MPIFVFFIIFAVWTMYEIRKSNNKGKAISEAFWQRENDANNVAYSGDFWGNVIKRELEQDPDAKKKLKIIQKSACKSGNDVVIYIQIATNTSHTERKIRYGIAVEME